MGGTWYQQNTGRLSVRLEFSAPAISPLVHSMWYHYLYCGYLHLLVFCLCLCLFVSQILCVFVFVLSFMCYQVTTTKVPYGVLIKTCSLVFSEQRLTHLLLTYFALSAFLRYRPLTVSLYLAQSFSVLDMIAYWLTSRLFPCSTTRCSQTPFSLSLAGSM